MRWCTKTSRVGDTHKADDEADVGVDYPDQNATVAPDRLHIDAGSCPYQAEPGIQTPAQPATIRTFDTEAQDPNTTH
jgi:hypothetical protein